LNPTCPPWRFKSTVPEIAWPALPPAYTATVLSVCFQLEHTQWLSAGDLQARQLRQLEALVRHAYASVPYYRERWASFDTKGALTWDHFAKLPLLKRRDLQTAYDDLKSQSFPKQHGQTTELKTSGSTGAPVRILKSALEEIFWRAFLLRDHAWQRRDLLGKLAIIRQGAVRGRSRDWGASTRDIVRTGPGVSLPVGTDIGEQLEWLVREAPNSLLSHPTNIAALARLSLDRGVQLPQLREISTSGEIVSPELRELCRAAWNVPVADMYSSNETGYIALQCPAHDHYHVQSEGVVVEVLDDQGNRCAPGQTGRMVVTPLHNFAMPLIRYEIGDYAEVGASCACGRGLPVLNRIMGRVRNMLVTADGKRYWPSFSVRALSSIIPVLQHQFVQKEIDLFEARLVVASPLTPEQEKTLVAHLRANLPPGFRVNVTYCDEIPRSAGGKFEDFISLVA